MSWLRMLLGYQWNTYVKTELKCEFSNHTEVQGLALILEDKTLENYLTCLILTLFMGQMRRIIVFRF